MKRAAGLLLLCVSAMAAAVSVRDDAGATIVLTQSARRVITLTPHATELVAAIAPQALVAVDKFSDYPALVTRLPRIGDYAALNIEAIVALKPDLVISWEGEANDAATRRLRELGIVVFNSRPDSVEAIASNLERLATLLGDPQRGQALAREQRAQLAALRVQYTKARSVRVFLQLGERPMYTVSDRAFLGRSLKDCGAHNLYGADAATVPIASLEAVLQFQPEVILVNGSAELLQEWQRFGKLPAVAARRVFRLHGDALVRPGPRFVGAMAQLCRWVDSARAGKLP
ncbi:MAG TPA: helical backbone metal receptor [Chitinolyticbacter sp.]|nr:helical backbone metal receptor [Chitinolyticbacter sp.]